MPRKGSLKANARVAVSDSTRAKLTLLSRTMTETFSYYYGRNGPKDATINDAAAYAAELALDRFNIRSDLVQNENMHEKIKNAGDRLLEYARSENQ